MFKVHVQKLLDHRAGPDYLLNNVHIGPYWPIIDLLRPIHAFRSVNYEVIRVGGRRV